MKRVQLFLDFSRPYYSRSPRSQQGRIMKLCHWVRAFGSGRGWGRLLRVDVASRGLEIYVGKTVTVLVGAEEE